MKSEKCMFWKFLKEEAKVERKSPYSRIADTMLYTNIWTFIDYFSVCIEKLSRKFQTSWLWKFKKNETADDDWDDDDEMNNDFYKSNWGE